MKAILEFDLDNTEDEARHLRSVVADDLVMFIDEFTQYLRGIHKYTDRDIDDIWEAWHEMRGPKVQSAVDTWN